MPIGLDALRLGLAVALLSFATAARARAQTPTKIWAYLTGDVVESSPALAADGTIYVGSDNSPETDVGQLYAIEPNGNYKWIFSQPDVGPVASTPAVGPDGTVYFGSYDDGLYAINPSTGAELWRFQTGALIYSSPAIGADGTIYVGSEDHYLYAVMPSNGQQKWAFQTGDLIDSSPAIGPDGTVYIGSHDHSVYALTPAGQLKWKFQTGDRVEASPAIAADGTVYVGSYDGHLYALTPNGNPKWAYPTGGPIETSPAIGSDGTVYFGSFDGYFYALARDGTLEWRYQPPANPPAGIYSSAAIRSDGTIIFGAGNNLVVALNPDGTPLWNFPTGDFVDSSPVIAPNGTIYVGSWDFNLWAISGNGNGPASTPWPLFRHDLARGGRVASAGPSSDPGRLVNLSVLTQIGPDAPTLTLGFFTGGSGTSGSQTVLLRGTGPALTQFGVAGVLPDPDLTLLSGTTIVGANDNWGSSAANQAAVTAADNATGAFALTDPTSLDAALVTSVAAGGYTVQITGNNNGSGYALAEVYDATPPGTYMPSLPRLINLSSQMYLSAGGIITAGFVVGGTTSETVLIRAIGPTLAGHGVIGVMPDPQLGLHTTVNGQDTVPATDAGWGANALTVSSIVYDSGIVGAFSLPTGSLDSAVLTTLAPGAYTVQVSSASGTAGAVLVEVYEVP